MMSCIQEMPRLLETLFSAINKDRNHSDFSLNLYLIDHVELVLEG